MIARSELAKWSARFPLLLSFGILGSTYALFLWFVLIKSTWQQGTAWRLAEQAICLHVLYGLAILSLITVSSRPPGYVQQNTSLGRESFDDTRPILSSGGIESESESENDDETPRPRADYERALVPMLDEDDTPLSDSLTELEASGGPKHRPPPLDLAPLGLIPRREEIMHHPLQTAARLTIALNPLVPHSAADAGATRSRPTPPVRDPLDPLDRPIRDLGAVGPAENDTRQTKEGSKSGPPYLARSEDGLRRYCSICQAYKPDRTHHCRHCRRCVKRMDHHCIWVNNCVGADNYKPFLLFVTYSTLICLYIFFEAGTESLAFFRDPERFYSSGSESSALSLDPVVYMLLALLAAFLGVAVGSLAAFHWYLASQNLTTLENMSYSYPTALLPKSAFFGTSGPSSTPPNRPPNSPASAFHMKGRMVWKPDHLLTRSERIALRAEARAINIFNLGWRRNLSSVLLPSSTSASPGSLADARGSSYPLLARDGSNRLPSPVSARRRPPMMLLPSLLLRWLSGDGRDHVGRRLRVYLQAAWPGSRSREGWERRANMSRVKELRAVTITYRLGTLRVSTGVGETSEGYHGQGGRTKEPDDEDWEDEDEHADL